MALTDIADQKTPGRPIEIQIQPNLGLPSANQTICIIGHEIGTPTPINTVVQINNVADIPSCSAEVATKFGDGSELAKMVLAAVRANINTGNFPAIKAIPLASAETGFGTSDAALTAASKTQFDFLVSPYDGNGATLTNKLSATCALVSSPQRSDNGQYGSIGVAANKSVTDPSTLTNYDTQYLSNVTLRDTGSNPYTNGEIAASYAAVLAGNPIPFNPVDDLTINGVTAPANSADNYTVGAGLESESALNKGWTPLRVKPNGEVAIVRSVTQRITVGDGITATNIYIDVQDWQVLYFWRKTLSVRFHQPDFSRSKASQETGKSVKGEALRLANVFEDQGMFQAVAELAPQFQVQRSVTDRSRLDLLTPVNVIPGLHVIATKVAAGVQFDTFTV